MRRRRAAAGMVLCAALASCAGHAGSPPARTAPSRAPATGASPTTAELTRLHDAQQHLIQTCMAAKGFRTWPVPMNPLPGNRDFPYVVDDVSWARQHGYGSDFQAQAARGRVADPNYRYVSSLTPARRSAALAALNGQAGDAHGLNVTLPDGTVIGSSTRGCTATAEGQLYGSFADWFRADSVHDDFTTLRHAEVLTDRAYRDALPAWRTCMRKRGDDYADPSRSAAAFLDAPDSPHDSTRERATATAEAECAHSSGLSVTVHRLDRHDEQRLETTYRSDYELWLRLVRAALPRAAAVLGGK